MHKGKMNLSRLAPPIRRSLAALALMVSTATLISSAQAAPESTSNHAQFVTQPCYIDGLSERLQCGYITVPENPEQPNGKVIDVHFAVLPAIKNTHPQEALLAIAGGPGQSAIENAAGFDRMLNKVRQQRDILLIDQRGTGKSNLLQCEGEGFEGALAIDESTFNTAEETQKCLDTLTKDGTDVRQYGSINALHDFEAIRTHLGYSKLHIYGISYGTRMAQLYMRHYPQHLLTVTLDGVVPMQQSVIAIGDAIERGFDKLLQDCEANTLCQQQFPQLAVELSSVKADLAAQATISQVNDPLTGETTQLTMTLNKFLGALRMALYNPNVRALIPHAIHQAAQGNYQAIMGLYAMTIDSTGIAMGMHTSVVCGEDWQRISPEFRAQVTRSYFGKEMLSSFDQSCNVWQMPAAPADFSAAIDSDIPTLVLSGELDPATPPSWGEMAMEKLKNAKHFIAPYATHGVAYQSCGNDLIHQLVTQLSVETLDASCLDKDVSRNFYLNASTVEAVPANTVTNSTKETPSAGAQL
ncbi:alpha/beta hydrolase [Shewanella gelidii]|uniref:Transporter n=1 Tax=Shewanella gelidii TaxID=1642821 RepID=A0A917JZD0_9GAMM|nr:alpha/beta hydrolase [Shewanella gelidii]MCL1098950.1 alpha/beta hydrolase [Shewanella gelidii]GGI90196.1 transporter [Shewanella gelidii]